ncbi:hypothetical protein E8E12_002623 [Didymella heteroderae]|uniref:Uncharacterized protein n=1 Tax=Didymella heteroderae TaxID=1769908 RepID=A0A9P4WN52_9PLEO|nr:hypothetical protein E8E12_002623 [Didymella heteroderae]
MPVHTVACIEQVFEDGFYDHHADEEEVYEYFEEEDALDGSVWIKNLQGLKITASALLSNTIVVANVEEGEKAYKQEFCDAFRRPRMILLKGYSDAVYCRFKPFLGLSYELRQKIWDFAMRAEKHSYSSFHLQDRLEVRNYIGKYTIGTSPRNPSFLTKACQVSKFTRQETLEVFIQGSMFQVCAIEQNRFMHSFLSITPKGFASMRRLQFAFFDCFPTGFDLNADLELAVCCPGLPELQISFHDKKPVNWRVVNDDFIGVSRPEKEMWDYYKMHRLLGSGVRFRTVSILRKAYGNQLADRASLKLARFVTLKFQEEKGRHVEARVVGNKFVHSLGD